MAEPPGVWLYAVARAVDRERLAELTGVAGESVRVVEGSGLAAVVGTVGLGEFGEQALQRNLEDLDWLEAKARDHDAVVHAVVGAGPAVPLRFATVCLDDERVRALLAERRQDFEAALRRLTGRTEWGVKGYVDPAALTRPAAGSAATGGRGAGTAYLVRRRAQLSAKEDAERTAAAYADDVHAALVRHSVTGRRHPAQHPKLAGRQDWMVLNGTYLVDDDRTGEFAAAVEALGRERAGLRLERTGPWPPYSFTGVDEELP